LGFCLIIETDGTDLPFALLYLYFLRKLEIEIDFIDFMPIILISLDIAKFNV